MALQALIFMLRDSLIIVSSLMMPVQIVQGFPTWFSYGFLGALRAYRVTSRGRLAVVSGFGPQHANCKSAAEQMHDI